MDYIEMAAEHGYTAADYTPEQLEEVGMAIERAHCDWSWYEAGKTDSPHYRAVVDAFYNETPTEKALVEAYAEGMVC